MKTCSKCGLTKSLSEYHRDNSRRSGYRYYCKSCTKHYEKLNSSRIRKRKQQYYLDNKEYILKRTAIYEKNVRSNNINHKITACLRNRIHTALSGLCKSSSTMSLLGCTIEELKAHLQSIAIVNGYANFNINNYKGSEYHIDHIRPCASFNLKDFKEQRKCFHYTNLQILSADDNLKKSNNIN